VDAGSASIRAAIAARTVDGSSPWASSAIEATSSSRKNGLPSATDTTRSIVAGADPRSRAVAIAVESASLSGSSGSVV
jgi:hypothetical protein